MCRCFLFVKTIKEGGWRAAQQLGGLSALAEDSSALPSIHVGPLETTRNPVPRRPTHLCPVWARALKYAHPHLDAQKYGQVKILKIDIGKRVICWQDGSARGGLCHQALDLESNFQDPHDGRKGLTSTSALCT